MKPTCTQCNIKLKQEYAGHWVCPQCRARATSEELGIKNKLVVANPNRLKKQFIIAFVASIGFMALVFLTNDREVYVWEVNTIGWIGFILSGISGLIGAMFLMEYRDLKKERSDKE